MARATLENPNNQHPKYSTYQSDEKRTRASFLARNREMVEFLVPHRHEGKKKGKNLHRANYGFTPALNRSWVEEHTGHIRGATVTRTWGEMDPATEQEEREVAEPSPKSMAASLYRDATLNGVTIDNFFTGKVLEWMVTSVGGCVVVDNLQVDTDTQRDEQEAGMRPYFRFMPASTVLDFRAGRNGLEWIKFVERRDERGPDEEENKLQKYYILYELEDDGSTEVTRFDKDGDRVASANLGELVDQEGNPTLPVVRARFGEHPQVPYWGTGLLLGPDDVIIDLYNTINETRAAYRDAAISLMAYRGENYDNAADQLEEGTRFVDVGIGEHAEIVRIAVDATEVQAGLDLIKFGVESWGMAAKRQVADAQERNREMSGLALQAEFQLDSAPLLRSITEELDDVETQCLRIAAQIGDEGTNLQTLGDIKAERDTRFRPENEADRIARLVGEFLKELPLPSEAIVQVGMEWLEASDIVPLDRTLGDTDETFGEVFERQLREVAEADQNKRIRQSESFARPVAEAGLRSRFRQAQ